jgi:hypothetical protein
MEECYAINMPKPESHLKDWLVCRLFAQDMMMVLEQAESSLHRMNINGKTEDVFVLEQKPN